MPLISTHLDGLSICYSEQKYHSLPGLRDLLDGGEISRLTAITPPSTMIVLGGDGTMLEAIHAFSTQYHHFLGIDFGTKGFLMNPHGIIGASRLVAVPYPLLTESGGSRAFNEYDLRSRDGKMLHLRLTLPPGYEIELMGDGIVISTPAGSTGYNAALGGPIIPHTLPTTIITPKAPWKPRNHPPILIQDTDSIRLDSIGRRHPIDLFADGVFVRTIDPEETLTISTLSGALSLLSDADHPNHWKEKVLTEQGLSKREYKKEHRMKF